MLTCICYTDICNVSFQVFAYDYCFWSMDEAEAAKFAGLLIIKIIHFTDDDYPHCGNSLICLYCSWIIHDDNRNSYRHQYSLHVSLWTFLKKRQTCKTALSNLLFICGLSALKHFFWVQDNLSFRSSCCIYVNYHKC